MSLDKKAILKEIEVLIRSIKVHYDNIENEYRIPTIELELITSKIRKLHEKSIIYNHIHYMEEEQGNIIKRAKFDRAILRPDLLEQSKAMTPEMSEAAIEVAAQATSNETIESKDATPELLVEIEEIIIHEPAIAENTTIEEPITEPIAVVEQKIIEPLAVIKETIIEPIVVVEEQVIEPIAAVIEDIIPEKLETPSQANTIADDSFKRIVLSGKIGINDRFRFIKHLFAGNGAVMEESLKRIEACTSTWEYNNLIKELKSTYNWDEEDETVIDFYNILL